MEYFVSKVLAAVNEYRMFRQGTAVMVALSGGADSVSLLGILKELESELGISVCACHLNHGLRGEESDSDEQFCVELCSNLDVPLEVGRVNVGSMLSPHESVEQAARRIRYEFFSDSLEKYRAKTLATAHTASDNAETVLFNLTRGTGIAGLCGIPPVRMLGDNRVVRPLIYCTRCDVEERLAALSQNYVTDRTNLSDEYSRNKIRLNVIPELENINPSLQTVISRMSGILREDNAFLEKHSDIALEKARKGRGWDAAMLSQLEAPIKARAVRKILESGGIEPSALRINTAVSLLSQRSTRYNPCKDKFFTIRKGLCYIEEIKQVFGGFNEKD